jgi:hypothetical protein
MLHSTSAPMCKKSWPPSTQVSQRSRAAKGRHLRDVGEAACAQHDAARPLHVAQQRGYLRGHVQGVM